NVLSCGHGLQVAGYSHRRRAGLNLHALQLDAQHAAVRHGVASVECEVEDNLLDLRGIGEHAPGLRVEVKLQPYGVAEQAPKHAVHGADGFAGVYLPGGDHLAPGECQQLPGEFGRATCGALDLLHVLHVHAPAGGALLNQVGVAEDGGEHVVEVVRHAAGQASHGFQLLGLCEPSFEQAAAGDVACGDDEPADVRVVCLVGDDELHPVCGDRCASNHGGGAFGFGAAHVVQQPVHGVPVFRADEVEHRGAEHVGVVQAEDPGQGR